VTGPAVGDLGTTLEDNKFEATGPMVAAKTESNLSGGREKPKALIRGLIVLPWSKVIRSRVELSEANLPR